MFFGKSLFSGQFSRDKPLFPRNPGVLMQEIHNFASVPALSTEYPEHLNFSEKNTSQNTFFPPEQLPVAAFDGSSQLRCSGGGGGGVS